MLPYMEMHLLSLAVLEIWFQTLKKFILFKKLREYYTVDLLKNMAHLRLRFLLVLLKYLFLLELGAHCFWISWKFKIFFQDPGKLLEKQVISLYSWKTPEILKFLPRPRKTFGITDSFAVFLKNFWNFEIFF